VALTGSEHVEAGEVRDSDGRLVVVTGASVATSVNILTEPALHPTTDASVSYPGVDGVYVDNDAGWTFYPHQYAKVSVATNTTDAAFISGTALCHIRILWLAIQNGATASTVTLNSKPAGAGTAISPAWTYNAYGGRESVYLPGKRWQSAEGEGVSVTTAAAGATVTVEACYIVISKNYI
jgi:hypothetical protein